ncbi:MAG: translocation/assembly module TamB domain-containing protein [Thermodesulfobacteriota bacterium]
MRKTTRALAWVLAALLAILLVLFLFLPVLASSDFVKARLLHLANQELASFRTSLSVEEIALSYTSRVTLSGLRLCGPEGEILFVERLSAGPLLPGLLQSVPRIPEVFAEGPRATLRREPDGQWELARLFAGGPEEEKPAEETGTSQGAGISLPDIRLKNGLLLLPALKGTPQKEHQFRLDLAAALFPDRAEVSAITLSDEHARVSGALGAGFSLDAPVSASLSASIGKLQDYADLAAGLPPLKGLEAKISTSGTLNRPRAEVVASSSPGQTLSAKASADLARKTARASLSFSRINLESITQAPATLLTGTLDAACDGWDPADLGASLRLALAGSQAAGITVTEASVSLQKNGKRLERLAVSARTDAGNLSLEGSGTLSGLFRNEEPADLALALSFDKVDPGRITRDEKLAGDIAGKLGLSLAKAAAAPLTRSEATADLRVSRSRLGRFNDLTLAVSALVNRSGVHVEEGDLRAEGVRVLFTGKAGFDAVGRANLSVSAQDISGIAGLFLEEKAAGSLTAEISAENRPGNDLSVDANVSIRKLQAADLKAGSLTLSAKGRPLSAEGGLDLAARDIAFSGRTLSSLSLSAKGNGSAADFRLDVKNFDKASLSAAGQALGLDRAEKRVRLTRFSVNAPGIALSSQKTAELGYSPDKAYVRDLFLSGGGQALSVSGSYVKKGAVSLAAKLSALDLKRFAVLADPKSPVSGRVWADVSLSGSPARPQARFSARVEKLSVAQDIPVLSAKADGAYENGLATLATSGESDGAAFSLTAMLPASLSFPLAPGWEPWKQKNNVPILLSAFLDAPDLKKLGKLLGAGDLRGRGSATLALSGSFARPMIRAGADVKDFSFTNDLPPLSGKASASYKDGRAQMSAQGDSAAGTLSLSMDAPIRLAYPLPPDWGTWAPGRSDPLDIQVEISSDDLKALRSLAGIPGLSGQVRAVVSLSGRTDAPKASAVVKATSLRAQRGIPRVNVDADADLQNGKARLTASVSKENVGAISVNAQAHASEQFLHAHGAQAWAASLMDTLEVTVRGSELDLGEALRYAWKDHQVSGKAILYASARGPRSDPRARVEITVADFQGNPDIPPLRLSVEADLDASGLSLAGTALPGKGGEIKTEARVAGPFSLPMTDSLSERQIKATLSAKDLSLAFVRSFTNQITELSVFLNATASVAGTLGKPVPSGEISITGDRISLAGLPEPFHDIDGKLSFSRDRISLEKLNSGFGTAGLIAVSGSAALSGASLGSISGTASAKGLNFNYRDMLAMQASANLSLSGAWPCLSLTGTMNVGEGKFALDRFLKSVSPDVTLDPDIQFADMPKKENGHAVPGVFVQSKMAVELAVDGPFWVKGAGAQVQLSGKLKGVKACGEQSPVLFGSLETVRGLYVFRGKTFSIQKGVVNFLGESPPDPLIDVSADYRVSDVVITLLIGGSLSRMALALSSTPPMTETDIASYLLFGKAASNITGGQSMSLMDQGASFFGSQMLESLEQFGDNLVPLDVLSISPGAAGGGTSLTLGKYITPDIFVTYRRGALGEGSDELSVEYTLGRGFSLQSTVSDQGSGADILWGTEY